MDPNVSTPCKDCAFAVYEGNKQIGCKTRILTDFDYHKKEKATAHHEGKEFYILKDFVCFNFRQKAWMKEHEDRWEDQLESETYMKWHAIIIARKGEDQDKNIMERLQELKHVSRRPPDYITVIYESDELGQMNVNIVEKLNGLGLQKWYFQTVEEGFDELSQIDIAIDKFKNINYSFYTVFNGVEPIPQNHYVMIHGKVFFNLETVAFIEHKHKGSYYGDTFFKIFHLKLNGNAIEGSLKDKLRFLMGTHIACPQV